MAKGKLTVTEKYTIQGMLHNNIKAEEIATALGRSVDIVTKYINTELYKIQETVAKVQAETVKEDTLKLTEEMQMEVLHKLRVAGMYQEDAIELINRTLKRLSKLPDNSHQMYVYCIKTLNAKDVMVTRTSSGKRGVSIMTGAASMRGDESLKASDNASRTSRGNVFQPKDNKMRND